MARVEKSIEVEVPIQTAYNQWTQFEEFPRFMDGIQEVHQVDDARLTWVAEMNGERKEWDARITRQVPDQVIAWESEGGTPNAGVVTFQRLGGSRTEVNVEMEYEPEDFKEVIGDKLGFVSRRVEGDLKRFKEFIEERGQETGAWRGRIDQEQRPTEERDVARTDYEERGVPSGGTRSEVMRDVPEPARPPQTPADPDRQPNRGADAEGPAAPSGPGHGTAYGGSGAPPGTAGEDFLRRRGRDQYGTEGGQGEPNRGSNPPRTPL